MKYEVMLDGQKVVVDANSEQEAAQLASQQLRPMVSDDYARGLAQGVPVLGAGADEMNAVTNAFLSYVFNPINELTGREYRDPKYNEIMAPDKSLGERITGSWEAENEKDKRLREAHPAMMTGLNVAGGLASMGGLVRSAPKAAEILFGSPGKGFFSNLGRSAVSNSAMGGADAFLRSDKDLAGRAGDAAKGAIVSGVTSIAVPLAAKTAITGAQWAKNVATNPTALRGFIETLASNGGNFSGALAKEAEKLVRDPAARQALIDAATTPSERGMLGQYIKSILGGGTAETSSRLVTGG